MYPWRRVLVPTDFSTASEWSFDTAIDMAGMTGAELVVLHVRSTHNSHPDQLRFPADESLYAYAEQVELDKLRERASGANASVATRMVVRKAPDAGAEISRTAVSEAADLVVIATHARHHVAHLIIGSTTLSVLHETPVPLLAIRYGVPRRTVCRRIVVPIHPAQNTTAAATLAAAVANDQGSQVHLVTVCGEADREAAERRLDAIAATFSTAPARAVIRGDDVVGELGRYLSEVDADTLFVNGGAEPIGTVKLDIIRRVPTPVMIVPPGFRAE